MMQEETVSNIIMARMMMNASGSRQNENPVSMSQIKMWLVPQKAEQDDHYDINSSYFELVIQQAIKDLVSRGYVESTSHDGIEDGGAQMFYITEAGMNYVKNNLGMDAESS